MSKYDFKSPEYVQLGKPASIRFPVQKRSTNLENGRTLASVVLINYNQGHYLEDALNSIINQTYPNIEIVVIDGDSTDNSRDILQSYPAIKWVSEPDNSSGHAFAKGAEAVTGEIVYFLNSSDGFFDNHWIEKSVIILEENQNLSLVCADVVGVNENSILNGYKWPTGQPKKWENKELFFDWLFKGTGLTPITFGIRREVLKRCAPKSSQMMDPRNLDSVDFFWYLIGNFFSLGFVGTKIAVVSSFARFHSDRVNDSEYLGRQRNQLHRIIVKRRRKLLMSNQSAYFISPKGEVIESESIGWMEIMFKFISSKFVNLLGRTKRDPFDID
jgi:glycosyltransferase involved in cell wall biosynthesis